MANNTVWIAVLEYIVNIREMLLFNVFRTLLLRPDYNKVSELQSANQVRSLLQVFSLAACISPHSQPGNLSRMHPRFQTVPCAVSSAVSHLERWPSFCSGQPPHVTSTTLGANSGLFFCTLDALRQILSMLLISAQGRHKNSLVQEAGEGNRARQAPKSNINF